MKVNRSIELLVLALALSVGALGCKNTGPVVTKLPPGSSGNSSSANGLGPGTGNSGDNAANSGPSSSDTTGIAASTASHAGWPEDREVLAPDTVHFEYDSTVIKSND